MITTEETKHAIETLREYCQQEKRVLCLQIDKYGHGEARFGGADVNSITGEQARKITFICDTLQIHFDGNTYAQAREFIRAHELAAIIAISGQKYTTDYYGF